MTSFRLHNDMDNLFMNDNFRYLRACRGGRLNIVAIGKTGEGKSATINTMISHSKDPKPNFFKEEESPYSVTKDFEECTVDLFNLNCRLVDTVGLFDTEMTPERKAQVQFMHIPDLEEEHKFVLANIADVISLCTDGVDAFIIVVDGTSRLSFETKETITVIQRFLGVSMLDHCIFVLTKEDCAQAGSMDKAEKAIADYLNSTGYSNIGDRFVRFDNRNRPIDHVRKLMTKIEMNLKARDGLPYTNVAFQHAQEMLKGEKQKLKDELETKMTRHIQIITDELLAKREQEMIYIEEQQNEYAIAMCGIEDDISLKETYQREMDDLKNRMANFDMGEEAELENAIQNAAARSAEEHQPRFRQLENNLQQQNRNLNHNNEIIKQLRNQINNLARR